MMTESNNLLYHPSGFDRLEEMEGGALTRYPVLRSVPVPMTRPWSTRGAIALLMVCGAVFGVIAIVSLKSSSTSDTTTAETTSADSTGGGVSIIGGSSSVGAGSVGRESSWVDDSDDGSTANDKTNDSSSGSNTGSPSSEGEEWGSASYSASNSFFDGSQTSSLEKWVNSQSGSLEDSASDAFDSESTSADSEESALVLGSDSSGGSVENWLFESASDSRDDSTDDSASTWQSSSSMIDEDNDSTSLSADSSQNFLSTLRN